MTDIDALQQRVTAAYAALDPPAWPDPHPDLAPPAEEEYSRVTDPERYRVVVLRARAWAEVLASVPGVSATALGPGSWQHQGHEWRHDRGVRLSSDRAGTLPLLVLERDAGPDEASGVVPVVHICAGEPEAMLAMLPDCGCDACDQGSDDLLEALDRAVMDVVAGPSVVLFGDGWQAHWTPEGGGTSGDGSGPDHRDIMVWCRRLIWDEPVDLPPGTRAYVGRSWLETGGHDVVERSGSA